MLSDCAVHTSKICNANNYPDMCCFDITGLLGMKKNVQKLRTSMFEGYTPLKKCWYSIEYML